MLQEGAKQAAAFHHHRAAARLNIHGRVKSVVFLFELLVFFVVMLIDTIGLSPHDYETIGKMRALLEIPGCKPNVFLAISASTKSSDLRDIFRNYETFEYEGIIVTKFDETNHVGNILSILHEKRKPVAYISSGQVVPRDFEEASVLRFLTKLTDFKLDIDSLEKKFPSLSTDIDEVENKKTDGGTL